MNKNIDSLIYFACNNYAELIAYDKEEFEGEQIFQMSLIDKIAENTELLRQLSTANLVLVLSGLYGDDKKEQIQLINELLIEKMRNGESLFAGSNVEKDGFMGIYYAWDKLFHSKNYLAREASDLMKRLVQEEYDEFKVNNLAFCNTVLAHCLTFDSIGNFLYHYKNGNIDEEKMSFLGELVRENPNILKKMNFGLLKDDIYKIGKEFVAHAAKYPNIAAKLILVYENNRDLYNHFVDAIQKSKERDSKSEYLEKIEHVLTYYAKNIATIRPEQMDDNLVECALYNHFQSSSYNNKNLTPEEFLVRNKVFDSMMSQDQNIEQYADIFSCRYFSVPYKKLKSIVEKYGQDDSILDRNDDLRVFLESAKRLIDIKDEAKLKQLYSTHEYSIAPSGIMKVESQFRRAYADTYVEAMGKTYDYILANSTIENGIRVCELRDDFGLPVHSTDSGFKENKTLINDSFKDAWRQRRDVSDHLISTAYTDQNFLGSVSVGDNGILCGFLKLKAEDINLIGTTDVNSHVRTSYYTSRNAQHYTASKLTRHGRRVYCEIAMERVGVDPDCIVVYDDMSEQVKANSYKAAKEFEIPIVKIDKTYIANRQLANIDKLIDEVTKTNDVQVLCELVNIYETNIAGWLLNRDENNPVVVGEIGKYVNEDGTDANPDRTGEIDHSYLAPAFMERGLVINKMIMNLIEVAKVNGEMRKVVEDMCSIVGLMQKEMQIYATANEVSVPITHTKFSFDGEGITKAAQLVLDSVDGDPKGTNKPILSITSMVDASLNGRKPVSEPDLSKATAQLASGNEKAGGSRHV